MTAVGPYSTKQVAKMAGISPLTLHLWQRAGKVRASKCLGLNGGRIWLWSEKDVRAVLRYKKSHYRKGRGRKKN